jgi:hypothetical protein
LETASVKVLVKGTAQALALETALDCLQRLPGGRIA